MRPNATEAPRILADNGQHGSDALLSDYFRIAAKSFSMSALV
jgi:hypothetical protein